MADLSLMAQILDYRSLGAMYEEFGRRSSYNPFFDYYVGDATVAANEELSKVLTDPDGAPEDVPMVSGAGMGSVERFDTDTFEYLYLSRIKNAAPFNKPNTPARVMQPTAAGVRRDTLTYSFNQLSLGMDGLRMLREPDNWVLQRKGRTEVTKQVQDFATQHRVQKEVFLKQAFTGNIYLNASGQILEPTIPNFSSTGGPTAPSGYEVAISTGVPSTNVGQLPIGGTNVITAAWSNIATDILGQLDNLRVGAETLNVAPPVHVWLNAQNKGWIRNNTNIKNYFYGIERLDRAIDTDTLQINNVQFHFYAGTYYDSTGTTQYYIPVNNAIITPELGPWFLHAQGLSYVPSTVDIAQSMDEMLNDIAEVYGDFAYAKPDHNPPSLNLFLGSKYFYGFRNPNSIFFATVA